MYDRRKGHHAPQGTPPRMKTIRRLKAQAVAGLPSFGVRVITHKIETPLGVFVRLIHPTKGDRGDKVVRVMKPIF